jgi:pimeloyl-ACP methyl ester carboxylesterase
MPELELSAGTIEYEDTGGPDPVIVLLHGLFMGGSLWRHLVPDLRTDFRCVLPELPMGAHRRPMRAGADLSGRGQARLVAELLDRLDLRDISCVASTARRWSCGRPKTGSCPATTGGGWPNTSRTRA